MWVCIRWHHYAHQPESEEVTRSRSFFGAFLSLESQQTELSNTLSDEPIHGCRLVKSPSSNIHSRACFSKTSFHPCLFQENILWYNWLSWKTVSLHKHWPLLRTVFSNLPTLEDSPERWTLTEFCKKEWVSTNFPTHFLEVLFWLSHESAFYDCSHLILRKEQQILKKQNKTKHGKWIQISACYK